MRREKGSEKARETLREEKGDGEREERHLEKLFSFGLILFLSTFMHEGLLLLPSVHCEKFAHMIKKC